MDMFCIPCFAYVSADERLCCAYCKMWIAKQALEAQRCGQAPLARLCLWWEFLTWVCACLLIFFVFVTNVRVLCLLCKCLFPSFFASPPPSFFPSFFLVLYFLHMPRVCHVLQTAWNVWIDLAYCWSFHMHEFCAQKACTSLMNHWS